MQNIGIGKLVQTDGQTDELAIPDPFHFLVRAITLVRLPPVMWFCIVTRFYNWCLREELFGMRERDKIRGSRGNAGEGGKFRPTFAPSSFMVKKLKNKLTKKVKAEKKKKEKKPRIWFICKCTSIAYTLSLKRFFWTSESG